MVRFNGRDVRKLSPGKWTLAGEKQVFRIRDADGRMIEDVIGHIDEDMSNATPMLQTVMANGVRCRPAPPLVDLRDRFRRRYESLADDHKRLENPAVFPVAVSPRLARIQNALSSGRV